MDTDIQAPRAFQEIHMKVKSIISILLEKKTLVTGSTALDAAAGRGHMSAWLANRGIKVTAYDLDISEWIPSHVECQVVDLQQVLPGASESFDLVASIETIEHLSNPYGFLEELIRTLRPGGHLIVSTPNIHSFKSRIKYLVTGLPALFDFEPGYGSFGGHISPFGIGHFLWTFQHRGIELVSVHSVGPKSSLLFRVVRSIVNAATIGLLKILRRYQTYSEEHYLSVLSDNDMSEMMDDAILIVVARKKETRLAP